jgi:hypothetical protein
MLTENKSVLTDELLQACASRAAGYDRDNTFFMEDFAELKEAGYLLGPVPKEFGGGGLSLAESCRAQSRLAYHAPPTALGINMHLYWVGVAADLYRWGDTSMAKPGRQKSWRRSITWWKVAGKSSIPRWMSLAGSACSSAANSNACSEMRVAAVFTRQTQISYMRWSRRPHLALISASSRAGAAPRLELKEGRSFPGPAFFV